MKKLIVIGIDGGTWDNLKKWVDEGELPLFKKIVNEGVHGINKTTIPCQTSPAIPCFYTGMNPVKTKTFGFRKRNGSIISSKDIKGERFWDILGENKIKSFIYGLRTTYPPKIKNGVLLSSLLVPDETCEYIYPSSEKKYFKGYFGKELSKKEILDLQKNNREELLNKLLNDEENRLNLIQNYLKNNDFDLYLLYFGVMDTIQHYLWNDQNLILNAYKKLENLIGNFLNSFKDYNLIIFSDHGFGKSPEKAFYLEKWLLENDYLKYKKGIFKILNKAYKKAYYSVGWGLEKYFSEKTYRKIYQFVKGRNITTEINIDPIESDLGFINMRKTKAYLDQKWGIRLIGKNIKNYEELREKLILELINLKDENNEKIFTSLYKKEELYKDAEKYHEVPDIIFTANQRYEIRAGYNNTLIKDIKMKRMVEGSHEYRREGIFIGNGPDIAVKKKIDVEIIDFVPTILHMFNIKIPHMIDGNVKKQIFNKKSENYKRKIMIDTKFKMNDIIEGLIL